MTITARHFAALAALAVAFTLRADARSGGAAPAAATPAPLSQQAAAPPPSAARVPVVVELFQENFTNRCFARLCQAKGLTYHAIVCECAEKAPLLIDTRGRIDVALLSSVIDRLG